MLQWTPPQTLRGPSPQSPPKSPSLMKANRRITNKEKKIQDAAFNIKAEFLFGVTSMFKCETCIRFFHE